MGADARDKRSPSLLSRLIGTQRPPWVVAVICLLLILAPIVAAWLDGLLDVFFAQNLWRLAVLPAVVIIYILVVTPIMERAEAGVVEAFRLLVVMDDDDFDQFVQEATRSNPVATSIAFGLGAAFGLVAGFSWLSHSTAFWLKLYLSLSAGLMFGLLGWATYAALAGTRLAREVHRQPLRFDILDTRPFEPIGRQSLLIALVFVGGIALSIAFGLALGGTYDWQNWLMYVVLLFVPFLVFFLNMRDTHRVLSTEKKKQLEEVQSSIRAASRTLMERLAENESTGTLGADINALVAYEERLKTARTWPYNTSMLRTLFVSVVVPAGAAVGGIISDMLF